MLGRDPEMREFRNRDRDRESDMVATVQAHIPRGDTSTLLRAVDVAMSGGLHVSLAPSWESDGDRIWLHAVAGLKHADMTAPPEAAHAAAEVE